MKSGLVSQRRGTVVEQKKNITFKLNDDDDSSVKSTLVAKRVQSHEPYGSTTSGDATQQ